MGKLSSILIVVIIIISGLFTLPACIDWLRARSGEAGPIGDLEKFEIVTLDKSYNITYNLDNGTLTENNPATYTLFTETFTLNNPTKEGYDFIGWTGTDISEPKLNVTICKGSAGDLEFIAHYEIILLDQVLNINNNILTWIEDVSAERYELFINDICVSTLYECTFDIYSQLNFLTVGQNEIYIKSYVGQKSSKSNVIQFNYSLGDEYIGSTINASLSIVVDSNSSPLYKFECENGTYVTCSLSGDVHYYILRDGEYKSYTDNETNKNYFMKDLFNTAIYTFDFAYYYDTYVGDGFDYTLFKFIKRLYDINVDKEIEKTISIGSYFIIIDGESKLYIGPMYMSIRYDISLLDELTVNLNDIHKMESFISFNEVNGEYSSCYLRIYKGYPNYSYNYGTQFDYIDNAWTFYDGIDENKISELESTKFFLSDYSGYCPNGEVVVFDTYFTITFEQLQSIFNRCVEIIETVLSENEAIVNMSVGELNLSEYVTFFNKSNEVINVPINLTINILAS